MNITSVSPGMCKVRLGMIAAMAFAAVSSVAETRYFDTNGAVPGFGSANGDWKDGSALWSADPTGASETTAVLPAETDEAVFGTTENPIETGTVQVYGPRKVATLSARPAVGEAVTFAAGDETATLNAQVIHSSSGVLTFDVPVSSDGDLSLSNRVGSMTYTWTGDLPATATLLFPGANLSEWTPSTGKAHDTKTPVVVKDDDVWNAYCVTRTGGKLTAQFQWEKSGTLYSYSVEFAQTSEGITGRKLWCKWGTLGGGFRRGSDLKNGTTLSRIQLREVTMMPEQSPAAEVQFRQGISAAGAFSISRGVAATVSGSCGKLGSTFRVDGALTISNVPSATISAALSGMLPTLKFGPLAQDEILTLSGDNSGLDRPTWEINGARVEFETSSFPKSSTIDILNGSYVTIKGAASIFYETKINVKDSTLKVAGSQNSFDRTYTPTPVIDHGVLNLAVSTYITDINLRNGSTVFGSTINVDEGKTIKVEGIGVSTWTNLTFIMDQAGVLTFNVANDTGDDEVDFILTGTLKDYVQSGYDKAQLSKTGAGTMEIAAQCTGAKRYPFLVNEGTLLLGVDDTLGSTSKKVLIATNDVQMAGGTLAAKTGTKQTLKFLTVTADSTIDLRGTATMSFADSSAKAWTAGAKLNILCESTEQITFAGLSDDQIGALRVNGRRVLKLDDKGHPVFPGLILMLK